MLKMVCLCSYDYVALCVDMCAFNITWSTRSFSNFFGEHVQRPLSRLYLYFGSGHGASCRCSEEVVI